MTTPKISSKKTVKNPDSPKTQKKHLRESVVWAGLAFLIVTGLLVSVDYWRHSATDFLATFLGRPLGNPDAEQRQETLQAEVQYLQAQLSQNVASLQEIEKKLLQERQQREEDVQKIQNLQGQSASELRASEEGLQKLQEQFAVWEIALETRQKTVAREEIEPQTQQDKTPDPWQGNAESFAVTEARNSLVRMNVELAQMQQTLRHLAREQDRVDAELVAIRYWARGGMRLDRLGRAIRLGQPFITELVAFQGGLRPEDQESLGAHLVVLSSSAASGVMPANVLRRLMRRELLRPVLMTDYTVEDQTIAEKSSLEEIGNGVLQQLSGLVKVSRIDKSFDEEELLDNQESVLEALRQRVEKQPDNADLQQILVQTEMHHKVMTAYRSIDDWFAAHVQRGN